MRVHPLKHEAAEQNLGVGGRVSLVDVGVAEDFADAIQDGELLGARLDGRAGGFTLVVAPVADPGLAEHILTETALGIPVIGSEGAVFRDA